MNRRDLLKAAVAAGFLPAFPASALLRGGSAIAAPNPLGVNLAAGGNSSLYYEGEPFFKNLVRSAKGFYVVGDNTTYVARTSAGWPATDFDLHVYASSRTPSWVPGAHSCGFIGTGAETVSPIGTGVTVSSVVHGSGGAYTTFTLNVPGGTTAFGFSVTGTTGGVTNVFDYPQTYNTLNTIDDVTNVNSVRTEVVNHLKQFSHVRNMWLSGCTYNTRQCGSANRHTPANTQTNNGWVGKTATITAIPNTGDTSATLVSAWTDGSGVFGIKIPGTTAQWRLATFTNGATTCDWTSGGGALTSAANSTTLTYGIEGYPAEWAVTIANAANIGVYIHGPIFEDGPNGSAGTWLSDVCSYIAAHYTGPGPVIFELSNENWNNTYYGTHLLPVMWPLYGFSSLFDYYAYRLHQMATVIKANVPTGWWLTKVFPMFAWQAAVPQNFAAILSGYSTYGTPKADLGYGGGAPYSNPPLANSTDSVATIEADSLSDAQNLAQGSNKPGSEQITLTLLHYGIPAATYEAGFQWNAKSPTNGADYSTFANLGNAIMDPVGYPACVEALYNTIFNSGVVLATHMQDGVSTFTTTDAPIDSMTTDDTAIDSSPTMTALKTFLPPNGITITRNDITTPGTVIDGRNYTDNVPTAGGFPNLGSNTNPGQVPYGNAGSKGTVGYLLYSRVARTVSLSANFTNSGSSGSTHLEYGSAPAGFSILGGVSTPTAITIPAGTNSVSIGSFTVVKGWNYVLLGVPGTLQSLITINSLTAG